MSAEANLLIVLGAAWAGLLLLLIAALFCAIRHVAAARAAEREAAHVAARQATAIAAPSAEFLPAAAPDLPATEMGQDEENGQSVQHSPALPGFALAAPRLEPGQILVPKRPEAAAVSQPESLAEEKESEEADKEDRPAPAPAPAA